MHQLKTVTKQELFSQALLDARLAHGRHEGIDWETLGSLILLIDEIKSPVSVWQRESAEKTVEIERLRKVLQRIASMEAVDEYQGIDASLIAAQALQGGSNALRQ